jgi:hypothetical protein
MNSSEFMRIERDDREGTRHYVVHMPEPHFAVELTPDSAAPDRRGRGVIKRLVVPNSWAGDYTKYAKFVTAAQEFFAASFAEPVPKAPPAPPRRS